MLCPQEFRKFTVPGDYFPPNHILNLFALMGAMCQCNWEKQGFFRSCKRYKSYSWKLEQLYHFSSKRKSNLLLIELVLILHGSMWSTALLSAHGGIWLTEMRL